MNKKLEILEEFYNKVREVIEDKKIDFASDVVEIIEGLLEETKVELAKLPAEEKP